MRENESNGLCYYYNAKDELKKSFCPIQSFLLSLYRFFIKGVKQRSVTKMPYRPNTPCKHTGCPKLVPYGTNYCDEHKALHPQPSRNANARGYDRQWRKLSKAFLSANPLCERCKARGSFVKATVVDHIIPHKGDRELFWDRSNWQPLCKHCHDVKTRTEDGGCARIEYKY